MGLGGIMSGVGSIGSFGVGLLNYAEQRKMNKWQKRAYKESLVREDTAVQRRAADLRAAGLSPVLAAGQGASTMPPISLNPPKMDVNPSELAAAAMTMMQQEVEISKTKEQEKLNAAQKELVDAQRLEVDAKRRETEWNLSRYMKHKFWVKGEELFEYKVVIGKDLVEGLKGNFQLNNDSGIKSKESFPESLFLRTIFTISSFIASIFFSAIS